MIYKIKFLRDDIYEVAFQGQKIEKSLEYLKSKMSSYKYAELMVNQQTSVRDDWGDLSEPKVEVVAKSADDTRRLGPGENMRFPDGYSAISSKHENLYELWQWRTAGGTRFVAYFFNLESINTLIDEDKSWLKYNKQLKKNLIEAELGVPKEPIEEIQYDGE